MDDIFKGLILSGLSWGLGIAAAYWITRGK